MAAKDERKKEEDRIARWRAEYVRAVNTAKGKNLATGREKKEALSALTSKVVKAGIPKQSWSRLMTRWDHQDKAAALHMETMGADDADMVAAYARLTVLSESSLPLFAAADMREMEAKSSSREEEQTDQTNVVRMSEEAEVA